jgi:hypothetical protein
MKAVIVATEKNEGVDTNTEIYINGKSDERTTRQYQS